MKMFDDDRHDEEAYAECVKRAELLFAEQEYEAALAALGQIGPAVTFPPAALARQKVVHALETLRHLDAAIKSARDAGRFDDFTRCVDEYLALRATDPRVLDLSRQIDAKVASLIEKSERERLACRFEEAGQILARIPHTRSGKDITIRLAKCRTLHALRSAAVRRLQESEANGYGIGDSGPVVEYLAELALEGIADDQVRSWHERCEKRTVVRQRSVTTANMVRRGAQAAAVAVVVMAAAYGLSCAVPIVLSVFSSRADVSRALETKHWERVLELDPENVQALVGRAREKLSAQPPDCDGAIRDLDKADRIHQPTDETRSIRAGAHAKSALVAAAEDDLEKAERNLAVAERLGGGDLSLKAVRSAIATAWFARAENMLDAVDGEAFKHACEAAEALGGGPQHGRHLWRRRAAACADRLDIPGVVEACREGSIRGLSENEVAAVWASCGGAALQKRSLPALRTAAERVEEGGADVDTMKGLRVGVLLLEAREIDERGDVEAATDMVLEAINVDAAAVAKVLSADDFRSMRRRLTKECLARVDAFIAEAQPQKAIELCDAAAALNPNANRWILESLSLERLRGLSEEALVALPPTLLAEAVAAVPETAELALPPLVNSVGMPLRLLHAGTVAMGGQGADAAQSPYQATISKRFFIGVHEVTNLQWKRVMGATPSKWKDDDRPVEQVTWEEAVEFCRRLSMLPDERAAGRVYRLPTEVEWEYACRAGTTSKRSFGDDRSQLQDHAWFRENASDETHPVGEKTPSPWGLHDMLGNVWEWCGDWHGEFPDHAATDPQGPPTGTLRVHRGGSWASGADRCDSASRGGYDPNHRQNHLGFRVVMTASQR